MFLIDGGTANGPEPSKNFDVFHTAAAAVVFAVDVDVAAGEMQVGL